MQGNSLFRLAAHQGRSRRFARFECRRANVNALPERSGSRHSTKVGGLLYEIRLFAADRDVIPGGPKA